MPHRIIILLSNTLRLLVIFLLKLQLKRMLRLFGLSFLGLFSVVQLSFLGEGLGRLQVCLMQWPMKSPPLPIHCTATAFIQSFTSLCMGGQGIRIHTIVSCKGIVCVKNHPLVILMENMRYSWDDILPGLALCWYENRGIPWTYTTNPE